MHRLTFDLTDEQVRYLQRLTAADVAENMRTVRSRAFITYGPIETKQTHEDIRVGASLLGMMPRLNRERAS